MLVSSLGRPCARLLSLALLALLPLSSALAESIVLGLDEAVRLALQRSAAYAAAQARTDASAESAVQAGQQADPTLRLAIENLPIDGQSAWRLSGEPMTMRRIGIAQPWISADKRAARSEQASQRVSLQQAEALLTASDVRRQTAETWILMQHAQRAMTLAQQLARHTADDLAAVEAAHRGGRASATDVAQARLALARAQDGNARARQALDTARIALQRWVRSDVAAVDDRLPALDLDTDRLEDAQLAQQHPALIRARQASQLAESEVTVAATERRPDWRYEIAYSQRGSQFGNMLSFGVTIPLTVNPSQRQDRNLADKAAQATAAQLAYDEARRAVASEIAALHSNVRHLAGRAEELARDALPAARQAVDLALASYRAGSGSLSAIFAARRTLVEQQLMIAELERDAALAWAQLSFPLATVGALSPEATR